MPASRAHKNEKEAAMKKKKAGKKESKKGMNK